MTPKLGQGARQAIEDKVVLARCLREPHEAGRERIPGVLRRYEGLRASRTAKIVRQSRRIGQIGQLENALLCWLRDRVFAMNPSKVRLGQLERVVGHEV